MLWHSTSGTTTKPESTQLWTVRQAVLFPDSPARVRKRNAIRSTPTGSDRNQAEATFPKRALFTDRG